jgi:hypothetical protein
VYSFVMAVQRLSEHSSNSQCTKKNVYDCCFHDILSCLFTRAGKDGSFKSHIWLVNSVNDLPLFVLYSYPN